MKLPAYVTPAWLSYTIRGLHAKSTSVFNDGHVSAERHMLNAAAILQEVLDAMQAEMEAKQ
jgi:hypothetical protein